MSRKDLIGYYFASVSKEGFMHVSVKPASDARLDNVVFQCVSKRMSSGYGIARNNIGSLRMICANPEKILMK
jgi:hypothetical protein